MTTKPEEQLADELRSFLHQHRDGWNHDEWTAFLHDLEDRGFDTSSPETIGSKLETYRIMDELERRNIPGLGPKRTESLAAHFSSWWELQNASEDDIASTPKVTSAVAERVRAAL